MIFLRDTILFGIVGIVGFVVDTAVLYLLIEFLGPFYARIISFLSAVFFTWLLNRHFTFQNRNSGLSIRREFLAYLLLMLGGGSVNYAVYAFLIVAYPYAFHHPILGVAAGSLAGMIVNLVSSRFLLFRHGINSGK